MGTGNKSRLEYWQLHESPAFMEDQDKSKPARKSNVELAAAIAAEGRVNPTPGQVAGAKRFVGATSIGRWCQNFLLIMGWLAAYADKNPGTYYKVEQRSDKRFRRLFFMPGIMKYIVPKLALNTVAIDGAHMKHCLFQFVLLLMVVQDGNLAGLPVAMAFVHVENCENYIWFLNHCKEALGEWLLKQSIVIVSDRDKGLKKA
eukprot:3931699-Rhodomonas_salina.1